MLPSKAGQLALGEVCVYACVCVYSVNTMLLLKIRDFVFLILLFLMLSRV